MRNGLPCRPTRASATAAATTSAAEKTGSRELNYCISNPRHNPTTQPHPLPPPPPNTNPFPTSILVLPTQSLHPSSNSYLDLDSNDPLSTPIQSPTDQSSVSHVALVSLPPNSAGLNSTIPNNFRPSPQAASSPLPPPPLPSPSSLPQESASIITPVLNLSDHTLTNSQMKALELGLKFSPTPTEVLSPLEFFESFRDRCTWAFRRITGQSMPATISNRLDTMEERLSALQPLNFDSNIPADVREAISQLKGNRELTIRQADKGSCLVVMNTSDYLREGYQHLQDKKHL